MIELRHQPAVRRAGNKSRRCRRVGDKFVLLVSFSQALVEHYLQARRDRRLYW